MQPDHSSAIARLLVLLLAASFAAGCASSGAASTQAGEAVKRVRLPILDMHLHARRADYAGPDPPPMCTPFSEMPLWDPSTPIESGLHFPGGAPCADPIFPARTDAEVMRQTIAIMEERNVIGMLGGVVADVEAWMAAAPGRFIPGLDFRLDRALGETDDAGGRRHGRLSVEQMRALHARGAFRVLGEVLNQYAGITPDDPRMEPYWALAEELDIPVGLHIGPGGPAEFYFGAHGFRARHQSALTLEEVLVRHPKLRVYIMHAGYPMLGDLLALMFAHPQVYVDIGSIVYTEPRAAFYRYLQGIVDAGYGKRVMFGSDQMIWPGIIGPAIDSIQEAPFLSESQKRDILYNNAARFLRLTAEEIARHQAM